MLKKFATVVGFGFLLLGILGFFFENFLGIFHLDTVHNSIHLGIGIWGVLASAKQTYSLHFTRSIGVLYLALGLLGFISPELFGLMPVGFSENVLHLVVGAIALYFGFRLESNIPRKASNTV